MTKSNAAQTLTLNKPLLITTRSRVLTGLNSPELDLCPLCFIRRLWTPLVSSYNHTDKAVNLLILQAAPTSAQDSLKLLYFIQTTAPQSKAFLQHCLRATQAMY